MTLYISNLVIPKLKSINKIIKLSNVTKYRNSKRPKKTGKKMK